MKNDEIATSPTSIKFTWNDGASNGGSLVIDYTVYYDQGVGDFIQLEAGVTTKSYTTSVTLIADKIYSFKVTARNTVGSSAQS